MGAFDLPRGEFELQLKDAKGTYWLSVMFTDYLDNGSIAESVEEWSENHKVLGARYNGKAVKIPKKYHWELKSKGGVLGSFKTRREAKEEMTRRKIQSRQDKTTRIGIPVYVED